MVLLDTPETKKAAAKAFREQNNFTSDRLGHNNPTSIEPSLGRITYMTSAKGYVMARRPGCLPFVITEKLWRSFPLWGGQRDGN